MEKIEKIFWTNKAKNDLKKIFLFLNEKISEDKSFEIIEKIISKVEILKLNPYIGSKEILLVKLKKEYRKIIEGNYKLIYTVNKENLYIHTVFDTRQNPNKLKTK